MKTTKLSLANIQGKLSRTEMKNVTGGQAQSGNQTKYDCECNDGSSAGVEGCDLCHNSNNTGYCDDKTGQKSCEEWKS